MNRPLLTPSRVLPTAAAIFVLVLLLLPRSETASGWGRLTTYDPTPSGARAVHDVLGRLGYHVARRTTSLTSGPLDTTATYLELAPAQPLTTVERGRLLHAVRAGATVVVAAGESHLSLNGNGDPLLDSLGFRIVTSYAAVHHLGGTRVAGGFPTRADSALLAASGTAYAYPLLQSVALRDSVHPDSSVVRFLWSSGPHDTPLANPAVFVLGRRIGRGHAIAIAPRVLYSNMFVRDPRPMIALVNAITWSGGTRHPVVFDEYHQGFGVHPNPLAAVWAALSTTPAGRMTLQMIVAALVLLAALAIRPLPPTEHRTILRRSPLEHVSALAAAYRQAGAGSLATDRLVRGLRRRHALGVPAAATHAAYLNSVRRHFPTAASDVAVLDEALANTAGARLAAVGAAAAAIERITTGSYSRG